jgi:WD40 repeat protein
MAAQAGMRVVPTRGLAYTQEPLAFVDESSVAFPFGSGVRVNFLAPDRGDGDGEFLWEENTWTEVTALASSWRMGRIAVCVAGKLNPPILLYSYPDKVQRGKLEGGVSHRYKCAAFCRSGERLAAIGTETDKRLVVWSLHRAGEGDAYRLEGSKLVETHLPGAMSFCSFNPANPDAMVTGGDTGLVLWHAVDLVDKWTISSSQLPKVSSTDMNAGMLSSQKRPGSSIASHAWGVNGTLWAAHTSGDIVCYDTKGGVEICNVRAGEVADEAVAMIVTKTYLIVAARSGALTWFSLPTPGGDVTVFVTASLSSPLSSVACSPLFDKLVAGTMDGKLLTVPIEAERHQSGLDATEIRSFHRGRVLSVASLRSLPSTAFEPAECVIASGGEDGFIRLYSSGVRPRSRGTRHFVHDGAPLPVTSLAATPLRPLLAAGLGCGVVHVLFAHNVSVCSESDPACSDDQVALTTIWREQLFSASGVAPVTLLAFHPTEALLAIGSSGDRSIFVVNLASPSGAFRICTHAVAPSRADDAIAGVTSLMWRGMNLIFSTGDNILCCADVDPAADASGSSPDKLRWSFSTTKPLHGMCLHPIISSGPFFAVSAERCALLVLPALPEKALGSREDRPPLDFLDALEAHDKSTTALSASIDGKFIATGGADGLVVLWRVYEQHVELLHTTRSHSGPITTLAFSMDSRALYSSSTDGTFVGLSLRNNGTQTSDEQGMATNTDRFLSSSFPPLDPSLASLAEECVNPLETLDQLPWKDEVAYEDSEPRKSVDGHQEVEQGNAASQALLSRMEEFKGRLHALLAHNSSRADVEKLSSDELIVDVRGRERAMATNRAAASELLSELRAKSMRREVIAARIRKECLESMEVRACQVWALQRPGIFVDNFPLRKRSKAEIARVEGVRRLRAIELRDIRRSGHITAKSWKGLLDEVSIGREACTYNFASNLIIQRYHRT